MPTQGFAPPYSLSLNTPCQFGVILLHFTLITCSQMTQLLILISAMLGTLTQAICCPTVISVDPKGWMCVLSAFNQAAMREEFFAWQDQQEQARLDSIMDQPVDETIDDPYYFIDRESWTACTEAYLKLWALEAEAAHDQHMEAKVWEHHAWLDLEQEVEKALDVLNSKAACEDYQTWLDSLSYEKWYELSKENASFPALQDTDDRYDQLIVEDCTTTEEDWLFFHPEGSDNSTLSDNPYGFDEDLDDYSKAFNQRMVDSRNKELEFLAYLEGEGIEEMCTKMWQDEQDFLQDILWFNETYWYSLPELVTPQDLEKCEQLEAFKDEDGFWTC